MGRDKNRVYTSNVISFIPLLYVAWADGLLSPSEVEVIHKKIDSLTHLSLVDKRILCDWADPTEWPDTETFKEWIRLLKQASGEVSMESLDSIAELGMAISDRSFKSGSSWKQSPTYQALLELEEELGIPGLGKFKAIAKPGFSIRESGLPVEEMQKLLDGSNFEIKNRVKLLLSDPIFAYKPIRIKEDYREKVLHWAKLVANQGFGALGYPEAYGGRGDMMQYAAVFEVLCLHDVSLAVKFGVQFGLFGGSVLHLGTKKHHDLYLKQIGTLDLPGCFAMTETGHGSNVRDLETTALYDSETADIIIHSPSYEAGKEYIGNALHASMATVFAQLTVQGKNHGVHAILVPLRDQNGQLLPGIKIEDNGYKMGLNGVDNGRIWFNQVHVPRENLLDRFGKITPIGRYESPIANPSKRFFTMLGTLVAGRICVAKGALSGAKSALSVAIKYALNRRQFAPNGDVEETLIMDYPSHQRRLIPHLAKSYGLHFALQDLIKLYSERKEGDIRKIESIAAGLKAYTTWHATHTIQKCREACGGKAYLWENRIADLKADTDIFTTFEGDNVVLMQLVAKGLLSSFRDAFHHAGFMGVIRFLTTQVGDSILTLNPVYKRKIDADHLLDNRFHRHAFQFRERKIRYALGQRMRNMFKKRITPYDVFLRCQNHMINLAEAFVELHLLEIFQQRVEEIDNMEIKKAVSKLLHLFALHTIEEHKGWYLEQDYLEGIKSKAIRRQVDRLCSEIRPSLADLVNAFGIPEGLLGAPIAMND